MANVLTNRVIYIDTTMGSSYQTLRALPESFSKRINSVQLLGGSAASQVIITDPVSGKQLANLIAPVGTVAQTSFTVPTVWRDFLATITGTGAVCLIFTV